MYMHKHTFSIPKFMEMRPNMNPLKENQYEKNAQKLKNVRYNKRETHQHTNDDDEQRGEQKKKNYRIMRNDLKIVMELFSMKISHKSHWKQLFSSSSSQMRLISLTKL